MAKISPTKTKNNETITSKITKKVVRTANVVTSTIKKVFIHEGKVVNELTTLLNIIWSTAPQFTHNENGYNILADKGLNLSSKIQYLLAFKSENSRAKNNEGKTIGFKSLSTLPNKMPINKIYEVYIDRFIIGYLADDKLDRLVYYLLEFAVVLMLHTQGKHSVDSKGRLSKKANKNLKEFGIEIQDDQTSRGYQVDPFAENWKVPTHLKAYIDSFMSENKSVLTSFQNTSKEIESKKIHKTKAPSTNKFDKFMISPIIGSDNELVIYPSYSHKDKKNHGKSLDGKGVINMNDSIQLSKDVAKVLGVPSLKDHENLEVYVKITTSLE